MSRLLLYPKPYGMDVLSLSLTPCYHISLLYIMGFDIKINHQRIQTTCSHAHTHHVDINVIIVIIAMLTLCYSIMLHATLILLYHAFMLTLHNSLTSHALPVGLRWFTRGGCLLVPFLQFKSSICAPPKKRHHVHLSC